MEYVTKKVPRRLVPVIHRLQAKRSLAEGRRVTEAEVIAEAVEECDRTYVAAKKKYLLKDLCGSLKGGPKANATAELDDVVYGDVDKT
ncbi:hypothetical protein AUJ14_05730 [Candidatus Micrarchaeota archaeon CG1_02_55_22]|nr:MAG: hypothetical protein AUJ14_05730 [Candidatus Micrarchaeota archaeon CG1_02_55_22]